MERLTPAAPAKVKRYHEARYIFATTYAKGLKVLDIACGNGYGSLILSAEAASVTGVDPSDTPLHNADHFIRSYAEQIAFEEEFDLVVSFETIEHTISPAHFLERIWRAAKPGGRAILSFPNDWGESRFHLHNTSGSTLELFRRYFTIEAILGQNRSVQIAPIPIKGLPFWVENIVLVGTKKASVPDSIDLVEDAYAVIAHKQRELRYSLSWQLRRVLPLVKTALKRRGFCRGPK